MAQQYPPNYGQTQAQNEPVQPQQYTSSPQPYGSSSGPSQPSQQNWTPTWPRVRYYLLEKYNRTTKALGGVLVVVGGISMLLQLVENRFVHGITAAFNLFACLGLLTVIAGIMTINLGTSKNNCCMTVGCSVMCMVAGMTGLVQFANAAINIKDFGRFGFFAGGLRALAAFQLLCGLGSLIVGIWASIYVQKQVPKPLSSQAGTYATGQQYNSPMYGYTQGDAEIGAQSMQSQTNSGGQDQRYIGQAEQTEQGNQPPHYPMGHLRTAEPK